MVSQIDDAEIGAVTTTEKSVTFCVAFSRSCHMAPNVTLLDPTILFLKRIAQVLMAKTN